MTVLSAQSIAQKVAASQLGIEPFSEAATSHGMSYGLSSCGYDIRIGKIDRKIIQRGQNSIEASAPSWVVRPGEFILLSSLERIKMPNDLVAIVHDKSTLARKGIAFQNTVLEPGWEGYITLELSNHGHDNVTIKVGQPICQLLFHMLDQPTNQPYVGKYQNQSAEPTSAIFADH